MIDDDIADRIQLVLAQKMLVGKNFFLVSGYEQMRLRRQVDTEYGFALQWLCKDLPNYKEIRKSYLQGLALDLEDVPAKIEVFCFKFSKRCVQFYISA